MNKTIICSHGFAVRADSKGLFTDISAAFSGYEFKMFDYYDIAPNGDQTLRPLQDQAKILQQQINDTPEGGIILLCHSQGCTVAGLLDDLSRVSRVILLAPPVEFTKTGLINRLRHRKGAKINPHGMSVIPRSDGTTMYIPESYMASIERGNRLMLYQTIANAVPTVIIRANQDEIINETPTSGIEKAVHIDIDANHNFTGSARKGLIDTLKRTVIFGIDSV